MKKWIIRWIIFQSILMFADIRMDAQKIRVRENFDDGWQFHKGDIAIKRTVKGGDKVFGSWNDTNEQKYATWANL